MPVKTSRPKHPQPKPGAGRGSPSGRADESGAKYLLIDCETTGLPRTRYFSPGDVSGWPHLVQLAWGVFGTAGEAMEMHCHIVKPDGFEIPADSTRIHGISHARAVLEGRRLADVMDELLVAVAHGVTALVAHNLDYDVGVVAAELVRLNRPLDFLDVPGICTMRSTTDFCRLPRPGGPGYKWPTLVELHGVLFNRGYEGIHDAASDLHACARCFFRLLNDGHYDDL